MKKMLVIIGIILTLLYSTNYTALFNDVKHFDRFVSKIKNEIKYQTIKYKHGETWAIWACLFEERLGQ